MRFSVKHSMSKAAYVLGLLGAAFAQTGCAHPVMVQPQVAYQQVGYPQAGYPQVYGQQQVYGQHYGAAPVVVVPRVVPQVVYAPPVYRPVYGFGGHHGWGHGGREGYGGHGGREGHGGWRR